MKNWYNFNGIFYDNKFLRRFIPQRKIGDIFKHKGKKYLVVESPVKEIGCTRRNEKGNVINFCAFCNCCNSICILKKGMCTEFDRNDKTSVAFIEYKD